MTARTLVISDLHIGARDHRSVVERPVVLEALLAEIDRHERLVLLGDLVELQEAGSEQALSVAEPILRAIGERIGAGRPVLYLPGNHDRAVIYDWVRAQGRRLDNEALVPPDASPTLAAIVAALAPAAVEVRYPGVWLTDRIWAHHGHYLNRYLYPNQAYGLMIGRTGPLARLLGRDDGPLSRPIDFEPRRRPLVREREATPHDRLFPTHLSPTIGYLLRMQVRGHSLPAVAHAARDLGVEPEYLVFGHVHSRGPLERDDPRDWIATGRRSGPKILNTGSWRWEPVLVHRASPPNPYWPGGAVVIDEHGVPRSVGLLDSLTREQLTG